MLKFMNFLNNETEFFIYEALMYINFVLFIFHPPFPKYN